MGKVVNAIILLFLLLGISGCSFREEAIFLIHNAIWSSDENNIIFICDVEKREYKGESLIPVKTISLNSYLFTYSGSDSALKCLSELRGSNSAFWTANDKIWVLNFSKTNYDLFKVSDNTLVFISGNVIDISNDGNYFRTSPATYNSATIIYNSETMQQVTGIIFTPAAQTYINSKNEEIIIQNDNLLIRTGIGTSIIITPRNIDSELKKFK
jgi:hypothetical protein